MSSSIPYSEVSLYGRFIHKILHYPKVDGSVHVDAAEVDLQFSQDSLPYWSQRGSPWMGEWSITIGSRLSIIIGMCMVYT